MVSKRMIKIFLEHFSIEDRIKLVCRQLIIFFSMRIIYIICKAKDWLEKYKFRNSIGIGCERKKCRLS